MKTAFLTFVLVFIAVNQLTAQLNGVNKGDQVRVTVASVEKTTVTGDVKDVTTTELKLMSADFGLLAIPVMEIERLEVRTRISKTARGAIMGGVTVGLFTGFVALGSLERCNGSTVACSEYPFLTGFGIGAFIGGFTGAIIGGAQRNQWWKIVPIQISPASKASGKAPQHLLSGFAIKGKINF